MADILEMLNGKKNMTPMVACNLKHKEKRLSVMPFKELAFFADFKRKVVKTHRHVYDYSAKS